jgi:hypothetical protein
VQEASALGAELVALVEAIADPELIVGLSFMPNLVGTETGGWADVLRWSLRAIELADDDPTKGNVIMGSPLALAYATRAMGQAVLGHPPSEWLGALAVAVPMAYEADPTTYAIVIDLLYGAGICAGALLPDDAALELVDEALQIAERSGDDFALANARLAVGLALMHRESPTERERGLTVLTQLRDMCLNEHFSLCELPIVEAYIAWEQGRRGDLDLDGAIVAMRAAVDDLFRNGQLGSWSSMATRLLVEMLLSRGGEADLQEADTAIERLAAAPIDDEVVLRKLWLLRLRALLAGARGDEVAHRDLVKRYDATARSVGWLGHMAMADSWIVRVAATGSSRILSASAKMSRNAVWNKVIQWSTAPGRRR